MLFRSIGLYKFMQDLPKYCRLHENGGIHIHLDMTEFDFKKCKQRNVVKNYITKRLTAIGKIFPKYTGTYNKKRVGDVEKGTWVNMSRLGTLEFRIAPLTFDYYTLMTWIVKLVRFRRILIHDCRLKSTLPKSGSHEDTALLCDTSQDLPQRLETVTIHNNNEGEVYPNLTGTPISIQTYSGTNSLTNCAVDAVDAGLTLDSSISYRFG